MQAQARAKASGAEATTTPAAKAVAAPPATAAAVAADAAPKGRVRGRSIFDSEKGQQLRRFGAALPSSVVTDVCNWHVELLLTVRRRRAAPCAAVSLRLAPLCLASARGTSARKEAQGSALRANPRRGP